MFGYIGRTGTLLAHVPKGYWDSAGATDGHVYAQGVQVAEISRRCTISDTVTAIACVSLVVTSGITDTDTPRAYERSGAIQHGIGWGLLSGLDWECPSTCYRHTAFLDFR